MSRLSAFEVALENAGYGAIDAASLFPDPASLTYTPAAVTIADSAAGMVQPAIARDLTRGFVGRHHDLPIGPINRTGGTLFGASNGERVAVYTGEYSMEGPLVTLGDVASGIASYSTYALTMPWRSSLGQMIPAARTDAVATEIDEGSWTPTTVGLFQVGMLVCRSINGYLESARVVSLAGGNVHVHPEFSSAPEAGDRIRFCHTFYSITGATSLAAPSVSFQYLRDGLRQYGFGYRLSGLNFSWQGEGDFKALMYRATYAGGITLRSDSSGLTLNPWTEPSGSAVTWSQGEHCISDDEIGTAVPTQLARSSLQLRNWELQLAFRLGMVGGGERTALGHSNVRVEDADCTLTLEGEPNEDLRVMRSRGSRRTVNLSQGPIPVATGSGYSGYGMCFWGGAMWLTAGAEETSGPNDERQQRMVMANEAWAGDVGATAAVYSPWCFGFPV